MITLRVFCRDLPHGGGMLAVSGDILFECSGYLNKWLDFLGRQTCQAYVKFKIFRN